MDIHYERMLAAQMFCIGAHCAKGQKRKYSGEDYHVHPAAVAHNLIQYGHNDLNMVQAAYLHDTVEDTDVKLHHIRELFGSEVADLVDGLTNKPELNADGTKKYPRAVQKKIDAERLSLASDKVKTIKLADKLDNLPSIIRDDPKFAAVYVEEARYLLEHSLVGGDGRMWQAVKNIIDDYDYVKLAAMSGM